MKLRHWLLATLLLLGGTLALAVPAVRRAAQAPSLPAFPPPPPVVHAAVTTADFAGADACAPCHRTEYAAWRGSTHGRAGGDPATAALPRAFRGDVLQFADARVTAKRFTSGRYGFRIEPEGGEPLELYADGVIGGGHLLGGGTQGFVTRLPDGTLRLFPFELVRREDRWFCNTNPRLGRGWLPIDSTLHLSDCGDWPPARVLGHNARFATCQECHGSRIESVPEPGRPHAVRVGSYAIDCESCHGPAGRHVALMRTGRSAGADVALRSLRKLDTDASLGVCFACHALKDAVRPGWLPGRPLEDHYSIALPLLLEPPTFADGRTRTFSYQQGHLYSDCYLNGGMTCTDCHEPHGQGYRDVRGTALTDRFDDRQCTGCHRSKAEQPELHTRHARNSEGSRCVSCHMPYLQQPEVGGTLRYARSDHTIAIPRPASDAARGIDVACAACHRNRDAATLQADVERGWGPLKPRPPLVEAQLRGGATPAELLDIDPGSHRMALFSAIAAVLTSEPAGATDRLLPELQRRALDTDPDVAAIALAALHARFGQEPSVRRFLAARLDTLGAASLRVRDRWAVILAALADRARAAQRAADAVRYYELALEVRPADPPLLLGLGLAYAQAGDGTAAVRAYRQAVAIDSTLSLAYVNLGIALAAAADTAGASRAYAAALRADSADALAWFNLGNLRLRGGATAAAGEAYARAVAADPALAPAHLNLARTRLLQGDADGAMRQLRTGRLFAPKDPAIQRALAELEQLARVPPR